VSNPLAPIIIEQIMREHMDRADNYRRATSVRALRERPTRTAPRVRHALGALVGRPAA
jgi:hypothetical protein